MCLPLGQGNNVPCGMDEQTSLMCLKHSGGMDSVALAAPAGKFWANWKFPAYYWVPFCIPIIIILPGDWIFGRTYFKVEVMDPAEYSGQNEPKNMFFG